MVDRTQAGSTYDKAWKAQKLDQIANVLCLSQRHKNDRRRLPPAYNHGAWQGSGRHRGSLQSSMRLLRGSRCFKWSHGWGKAVETAHVHVLDKAQIIP